MAHVTDMQMRRKVWKALCQSEAVISEGGSADFIVPMLFSVHSEGGSLCEVRGGPGRPLGVAAVGMHSVSAAVREGPRLPGLRTLHEPVPGRVPRCAWC